MKKSHSLFSYYLFLFLVIVLIVLFTTSISLTYAEEIRTMYVNVDYGTKLNIREEPELSSSLVTKKHRGDVVYVTREEGDWSFIICAERNYCGWAKTIFLSPEKPEIMPLGKHTIIGDGRVAVRSGKRLVLWKTVGSTVTVLGWEQEGDTLWAIVKGGRIDSFYLRSQK